ncbi:Cytochrome c oxidase assembly protein COX16, mitochondrial [Geodia barretti]|uniref:Cytochrome c oxidase assembly protein COX16 homolog, mitochondrial n=1 Tax=Geodia barretti TaxID=519541 RepID=A0AA35WXY9_GEOBA|nr:Cytochrome c oxidase assembly protein COX16, mitochondrial [Geodia barretti]
MLEPLLRRARVYAKRSRFLRFGLPFLSFMVLGSFGLAEFTDIRVKKRDEKTHMLTAEETLQFQKKVKVVDVEEELEKTLKELDIEHWVNKRVPRPPGWED